MLQRLPHGRWACEPPGGWPRAAPAPRVSLAMAAPSRTRRPKWHPRCHLHAARPAWLGSVAA
eukprot:11838787-Prorocentrum_lima.AAC.1